MTSAAAEHHAALRRLESDCYLAGDLIPCRGRLQAAHYPIPKQTLIAIARGRGLDPRPLISHPGSGFLACETHHHLLDLGGLLIRRCHLPGRFFEFEALFELRAATDRLYDRRRPYSKRLWRRP